MLLRKCSRIDEFLSAVANTVGFGRGRFSSTSRRLAVLILEVLVGGDLTLVKSSANATVPVDLRLRSEYSSTITTVLVDSAFVFEVLLTTVTNISGNVAKEVFIQLVLK